ncbi:MAG: hypothetical protein IT378_10180 [Sandaracinaceae bacterium]|nr:hypothetical protein [Sandaracinaceae bacterium]
MSTTFECQSCGAALVVEAHERTANCAYCASPNVVARPPSRDRPSPSFVLGFVVPHEHALETARRWVKRPLFAPRAFRRAVPSEIRGLYAPAYLYSAAAYTSFSASIGENYTVTETYTTTVNGKTVIRTRTKTVTEWRSLSGQHATYVSDRVVTASRGIPNDQLEAIEPFDLRALHRFTPKIISGWAAEEPSMAVAECVALARREAVDAVGRELGRFMPGDSHRNLQWQTRVDQEDLALALLPIWVLPVRYAPDKPPVRLLVNGQTGSLYGKAPVSWMKVTLAILLVVALIAALVAAVLLAANP